MKKIVKILSIGMLAGTTLLACKKTEQVTADELTAENMPAASTAATPVVSETDLTAAAQKHPLTTVALSESMHDFGTLKPGQVVEHIYEITNTGENPLIISEVKPGCGCTAPDYTKTPILPGEKGQVTLKFDSAGFEGMQHKTASVYTNTVESPIILNFTATIQ